MGIFNLIESEEEKRVSESLANSYVQMMTYSAWTDMQEVMNRIMADAYRQVEQIPIKDLTIAHTAFERGVRYTIDKLRKEVEYKVNRDKV